jgi:hypothetical protein
MLTGDYTLQCRKHIGLCTCKSCTTEGLQLAANKRRRWLYNAFLEIYSKKIFRDASVLEKGAQ